MVQYDRPPIYAVSHVVFGFLGAFNIYILILVLLYQFGQYAWNVRVFPLEGRIEKGNTWQHTAVKLYEVLVGFVGGLLLKKCCV
jgi:hypothetical protein